MSLTFGTVWLHVLNHIMMFINGQILLVQISQIYRMNLASSQQVVSFVVCHMKQSSSTFCPFSAKCDLWEYHSLSQNSIPVLNIK